MTAESSTFCILPWIHFYANPDGNVLPCCIGDWRQPLGNTRNNSIQEIWNSDEYKKLRLALLNNEKPSTCTQCWKHEEAGLESNRIAQNNRFIKHINIKDETKIDGSLDLMKLLYFDVRWSNICNFKCRTCSSTYSSSWALEDNKNGEKKPVYIFAGGDSNEDLFNQFKPYLKDIQDYYFAGGEPLITDKHYDILDYLIENKKTDAILQYNSNLSNLFFKKKSITEYWNNFKHVEVRASIDGYGNRGEYIREGTDWPTIEQNLKIIKEESPHVIISFNCVVSAFNVLTLVDFLEYMTNKGFDVNNSTLYNIVEPNYYSFNVLTDNQRQTAIDKLQAYINTITHTEHKRHVQGVIDYLYKSTFDQSASDLFKSKNMHFDKIRNRSFDETFPELSDVLTD